MLTNEYCLSDTIPYNLLILSSPKFDRETVFKVGRTVISGKVIRYCEVDRKPLEEITYENCKWHGIYKAYYISYNKNIRDKVIIECTYFRGELCGTYTIYGFRGNVESTREYKNGKLHGSLTTYYESGSVCERIEYFCGEKNGHYITYHSNGNKSLQKEFKKDISIGGIVCYDINGNEY